jgi:hypothetical protein
MIPGWCRTAIKALCRVAVARWNGTDKAIEHELLGLPTNFLHSCLASIGWFEDKKDSFRPRRRDFHPYGKFFVEMEFLPSTPLVETQGYTKPQAVTSGRHPIAERVI